MQGSFEQQPLRTSPIDWFLFTYSIFLGSYIAEIYIWVFLIGATAKKPYIFYWQHQCCPFGNNRVVIFLVLCLLFSYIQI